MVESLRLASETGIRCRIAFDPRVQNCEPAQFLRVGSDSLKPVRNQLGQVTTPAWITFPREALETHMISIPVKGSIVQECGAVMWWS
jgi:hypothetical protein